MPSGDWGAGEKCITSLPGREADFRASVVQALDYVLALGTERQHANGLTAAGGTGAVPRRVHRKSSTPPGSLLGRAASLMGVLCLSAAWTASDANRTKECAAKTRWPRQRVWTQDMLLLSAATASAATARVALGLGGIAASLLLGVAARSRSILTRRVARHHISRRAASSIAGRPTGAGARRLSKGGRRAQERR